MFLLEPGLKVLEDEDKQLTIISEKIQVFFFKDEKTHEELESETFILVNLKLSDDLSSGDVVGFSVSNPRFYKEKKNSFKSNLEAPFPNSPSCRKRLKRIITTREKKHKALFSFFTRVWYDYYFIAKVIHFCFSERKKKRVVDSFFKILKVGFCFFITALAPCCLGFFLLLKLGNFYRRKGLYFLIKNFKIKFKRLAPKRRMHRKKRKNK